jgi:hypothetical protein
MPTVRATRLLVCVATAATLAGCAGARLASEPPAGVNLAGAWKLDHASSDDPQKLLAQMRAQAFKIIDRQRAAQYQPPPPQQGGMRGGAGARQDQDTMTYEDPLFAPGPDGRRPDPLQRSPMAKVIMEAAARGEFLTIRQSPDELMLDYGTSRRSYTPGGHSVVSTETGVGDQTSGWKGREYVIDIRSQLSSTVTESYGLSSDGHELVDKLHIARGELPEVTLTRIYRPTTEVAPQQLPSTN